MGAPQLHVLPNPTVPKPAPSCSVANLCDNKDFDWDLNDAAPAANKYDDDRNISGEEERVAAEDLAVAGDFEDEFGEEEQRTAAERALPPRNTRAWRFGGRGIGGSTFC